jgi:dTDP-4-amino-4,6-dideoxygalactose transaminase
MPVHLYGLAADMVALGKIAERHNLAVVEDAAQAHGAQVGGRFVGAIGTAGCFSFYPTKNMHSLEGGMIATADAGLARRLRLLRNQGMEQRYANEIVGTNSRLTDVAAAIGRQQLRRLDRWTNQRRANAAAFDSGLQGVRLPQVPVGFQHVYHQYTVRVPQDRDRVQFDLARRGVGSAVYYPTPIHRLKPYLVGDRPAPRWELPETDQAAAEVLSLPVYPSLSESELAHIVNAVNDVASR